MRNRHLWNLRIRNQENHQKSAKAKVKPTPVKLINIPKLKKTIPPDTKIDETSSKEPRFDDKPMKASGPSSGHRDVVPPERPEPQPDAPEQTEEPETVVESDEKKGSSQKGTVSIALQRIHAKL